MSVVIILLLLMLLMDDCESLSTTAVAKKSISTVRTSRLLARQIEKTPSLQDCLHLLDEYQSACGKSLMEAPFVAVLHVCSKHNALDEALRVYQMFPSEACRSLVISVCGKCRDHKRALELLPPSTEHGLSSHIASYHSAMAACAKANAWEEAWDVLKNDMPSDLRSTLSCNIVLTAMARSKRAEEALQLLHDMKEGQYPKPDLISYQRVMAALIANRRVDQAYQLMNNEMDLTPNDRIYDLLSSAYSKIGNWKMVAVIDEKCKRIGHPKKVDGCSSFQPWTDHGGTLIKVGRGKSGYWMFGKYTQHTQQQVTWTIAFQPNRNPARNGIKILLLEGNKRIGHLLMINSSRDQTSTLLGVFLDPRQRCRGLSKVIMGIWMQLCLEANVKPVTGIMNKPLLCLVLQYTFGYQPLEHHGVDVEITPPSSDSNGAIVLYSPSKTLLGAFSPNCIKREKLVLSLTPTQPRGRSIRVGSPFLPPDKEILAERVTKAIEGKNGDGCFEYKPPTSAIRSILLGQ